MNSIKKELPSMQLLLTGCAGFIGSHTTKLLLSQGHQVVGIDNLNDYYDPRVKSKRLESIVGMDGFQFRELDIEDGEALDRVFSEH